MSSVDASSGQSPGESPFAKTPKGRGVIWMRRLSNIGFGIAALYFVYLVALLFVSYRTNAEFEGQSLGSFDVEYVTGVTSSVTGSSGVMVTSGGVEKAPLWSESAGRKQAVVLWATWCGPCHSLLMELKDEVAAGRLKPENVVAVSMVEPLKDVTAYLEKTPLPFRVALDRQGDLARRLKVSGTPTVMLLDEKGVIRKVSTGGFGLPGTIADFLKP